MAQLVLGEQGYDLQPQASALPDPNRLRAYYFEVKLALPGGTQGLPPVQFGSADAAGAGGGTIGGGTPMGIQIDSRTGPRSFA